MTRGEVWTVSASGYAGKPRPAVIVQDDRFDATASVTICVFTTDDTEAPLFRTYFLVWAHSVGVRLHLWK